MQRHAACRARERNMGAASRCLPSAGAQYGRPATGPSGHRTPLVQRGDSMAQPCRGDCEADCIILLGCVAQRGSAIWPSGHRTVRPPQPPLCKGGTAWRSHAGGIVKRIASFCLAACRARERSMGAAARRYFVLRRNNTLPRPKIPLWGFWSSSPQRRLWLLGGANLGRWEIKCSWAHRGVSP